MLAGVNVACGAPAPESGTVCGLFGALSVIVTLPVRAPVWVGLKVTLILQVSPAARVLAHGFGLVTRAKSPLATMLLMFNVPVPLFVSVTSFPGAVTPTTTVPHVSDVGDRLRAAPPPLPFTVSVIGVDPFNAPDVPLTVTGTVPVVAVGLAVKVRVLVELVGLGLNPAVTPLGKPAAERVTLPLNPFTALTVIVLVPLLPCDIVRVFGEAESVKLGVPEQLLNANDAMPVCQL